MHVEAMSEGESRAGLQIVLEIVIIDRGLMLVGRKDHDDVGPCGGFSIAEHLEAGVFSLFGGRGTGAQGDGDFCHAGIAQVLGVGMALTAISAQGDFLDLDTADLSVTIKINPRSEERRGEKGCVSTGRYR